MKLLVKPFASARVVCAMLLNFTLVCSAAIAVEPFINYIDKAKSAEQTNNLDTASRNYLAALEIAKKSDHLAEQVQVLCALSRMWTMKPDLKAAEPYYEEALRLTRAAKQQAKFRENLVWMNDLADAYYAASRRTFDPAIKAYCVWRYSMIHLTIDPRANQEVFGNISKLAIYFCMIGKYHEAEALCAPRVAIYQQTPGHDPSQLGQTWLILGNVQVGAHAFERAKNSFKNAMTLLHITGPTSLIDRQLGNISLFQNDYNQARAFYLRALQSDQQVAGNKPNSSAALDYYLLGVSSQQEQKNDLAEKYLNQSLAIMSACLPPRNEVLVFPYDELARIYDKDPQKKMLKDKCLRAAMEIRSAHPECQKTTPAQQKDYYMIWGSMPVPIEISPSTQI